MDILYKENYFYNSILQINKDLLPEVLNNKKSYYYELEIPKKQGTRKLSCLERGSQLYILQNNLVENFLNRIPLAPNCIGFVKGYSYKDFLLPHLSSENEERYYVRIDISNFFDSITVKHLDNSLNAYVRISNPSVRENILKSIGELCTLDGTLPQGAVSSPVLSNIIFRKLDLRIKKYCDKLGFTYTRYADDLLFSSTNEKVMSSFFVKVLQKILYSSGFSINFSKIRKSKSEISLNGFVIGKNLRLSREKKKDISKVLFVFKKGGTPKTIKELLDRLNSESFNARKQSNGVYFSDKNEIIHYLCGYRSFVCSLFYEEIDQKDREKLERLLKRMEKAIKFIELELQ